MFYPQSLVALMVVLSLRELMTFPFLGQHSFSDSPSGISEVTFLKVISLPGTAHIQ